MEFYGVLRGEWGGGLVGYGDGFVVGYRGGGGWCWGWAAEEEIGVGEVGVVVVVVVGDWGGEMALGRGSEDGL